MIDLKKEDLKEIKALLNKFNSILENDVPAFRDELQPLIEKQIENIENEIK